MPLFQISITPTKRAAGRFVNSVRRSLQKAFVEENRQRGLTQSDIARQIGVHRSVIHRELHGFKDITVGRVGELAFAMGRKPVFDPVKRQAVQGTNHPPTVQAKTFPTDSDSVVEIWQSQGNPIIKSKAA